MSGGILDMRNLEKTGMGQTPDDIKEKCLKLCQDYLSGVWLTQTIETITIERLTGGMLNQLYYVSLNSGTNGTKGQVEELTDVPTEVAIKLTQKKPFLEESESEEKERLLGELVVSLMVSENGLGPKIYGVFDGGVIQKYYRQKPFKLEEQKDERLVEEVFRKLAKFHSMEVPISRNKKVLMDKWLEENYKICVEHHFLEDAIEANIECFKNNDYHQEYKWINQLAKDIQSPIVFTHNDYRSDNLMVLTDENSDTDGNRIVVVDYEFCNYSNRGIDLVHLIKEWGNDNAFFDRQNLYYPPEDSVLKHLLQYYYDESVRIYGQEFSDNPLNSVEHVIKELKVFWLLLQFAWSLPFGKMLDENHVVPEEMLKFFGGKRPTKMQLMKMSEHGYGLYLKLKDKFREEKLFD